jgi:hypothetical protein
MKRYRLFLSEIKAATSKRRSENDSSCCISNSNQWRVSISRSRVEAQKSRYYFILIRNRILLPKSVSLLVILSYFHTVPWNNLSTIELLEKFKTLHVFLQLKFFLHNICMPLYKLLSMNDIHDKGIKKK